MRKDFFTLQEFLESNPRNKINSLDYLHAIFKLTHLPSDVVFSLMELFWPNFKVFNGTVFLEQNFDFKKYNDFCLENYTISEIQFWINLIELTSIFENFSENEISNLAYKVREVWNIKLATEFKNFNCKAKLIKEKNGEIYITVVDS